ncbi:hypothetical protein H6776_00145 [Candidatus Nomurabacteria bacterium]|nr:hypothetical protein [Candidatus Nomurabacteria bacterium]
MNIKTTEYSFKLQPSSIPGAGVGVFALHDIASQTLLDIWSPDTHARLLRKEDVPPELIVYCVAIDNDLWSCPAAFNHMQLA